MGHGILEYLYVSVMVIIYPIEWCIREPWSSSIIYCNTTSIDNTYYYTNIHFYNNTITTIIIIIIITTTIINNNNNNYNNNNDYRYLYDATNSWNYVFGLFVVHYVVGAAVFARFAGDSLPILWSSDIGERGRDMSI